ncbi:MAG: substrate-binding domain-containing protein [Candidatus Njordarchaeales archaeon]
MSLKRKVLVLVCVVGILFTGVILYRPKIRLLVSTTTSLYATGLLDELGSAFMKKHPYVSIQFIAVGSGAALRLAAQGDVDMVLVHAPNLEIEYIQNGIIINKTIFAYNYFIVVGPIDDPANISGLSDPIEAIKRIYNACESGLTLFVSRGDLSGTHQRELLLWKLAGLDPRGKPWYIETGSGMAETLLVANEKNAYTLSDIGTFLKFSKDGKLPYLASLVAGGRILINIYSAYIVDPNKYPHVKYDIAKEFLLFLISDEGQNIIKNYGVKDYGQPLFYPAKGKLEELEEYWLWLADMSTT